MLPCLAVDPISERLEANTNCLHSVADKMNGLPPKVSLSLVLLNPKLLGGVLIPNTHPPTVSFQATSSDTTHISAIPGADSVPAIPVHS